MDKITITKKVQRRGDDGHKIISLRIKLDTLERIEDIANKTDRSRNDVINTLLSNAIEHVLIED